MFPFYFDRFNLIFLFFAYVLKEQNPPLNQKLEVFYLIS